MTFSWLLGLLKTRTGRVIGSIAGIAMTVALIAALGTFVETSAATMTARAVSTVAVDWQVEMNPGSSPQALTAAIGEAASVKQVETVGYAAVDGFEFKTGEDVQATGAGKIVGIGPSYRANFPEGFRLLAGKAEGAVLLQQTAANLHAGPGDIVTVHRPGLPDARIAISGIIDLKTADGFFQAVGLPPGAAPQAPPDNAAIIPMDLWRSLFDQQATLRPDSVRLQLHAVLDRAKLPRDPAAAYLAAVGQGHNFEARVAGSAILSNNLAAKLDSTRQDALYVRVLFLFLGAPGVCLAALITMVMAQSGSERRRRDQSLLRLHGADRMVILGYALAEASAIGIAGGLAGIALAELSLRLLMGRGLLDGSSSWVWPAVAILIGIGLAGLSIAMPAWQALRTLSVMDARGTLGVPSVPLWRRLYIDLILLGLSALVFWKTASTGYQIVLAPEGVPATSVDYTAFLAPILLWIGAGFLILRLSDLLLDRCRPFIARVLRRAAGDLSDAVAASLQRQRRRVGIGIALTAMAFAFASSTAIFNATYDGQARVDAQLTNGADVTATGSTSSPAGAILKRLSDVPGVMHAEAMQHRFAYVGTDLQDLYGIDTATIGAATTMANAYFANGDSKRTLEAMGREPSGILVSDETVTDFQLKPGDMINLRLQGADHQYHAVPFVFTGIVREFPTAPRDSFLIANAAYVARMTGVDASEIVLMRTDGDVGKVRAAVERALGSSPGIEITDVSQASRLIASSLTVVDLSGLTRLELTYAVLLVAGATGLVLALGLADRRRSFAILSVLGARQDAMAAFIWSEGAAIAIGGGIAGTVVGALVAKILVQVLQGVFDPPPEHLAVPIGYFAAIFASAAAATVIAILNGVKQSQVDPVTRMKQLQ